MHTVLKASGSDLKSIIKVNIYLSNFKRDFALMNEVYATVGRIGPFDSGTMGR
jgi:enamine deaminase RidA (YjgF/YER057c/UK114 family)